MGETLTRVLMDRSTSVGLHGDAHNFYLVLTLRHSAMSVTLGPVPRGR